MSGVNDGVAAAAIDAAFRLPFVPSRRENEIRERALAALEMAGLADSAGRWAADLVWTERQLVQIARALVGDPKLLLLDEPASGMGVREIEKVEEIIRAIRDSRGHRRRGEPRREDADEPLRPCDGPQLRREDRRRPSGGDPQQPARPGGIPWRRIALVPLLTRRRPLGVLRTHQCAEAGEPRSIRG